METCRLCLMKGEVDNFVTINTNDNNTLTKIQNCVSIEIEENDSLPKTICFNCEEKLNTLYNFKNMCLKSDELLKSQLLDDIKSSEQISNQSDYEADSETECDLLNATDESFFTDYAEYQQCIYKCGICCEEFSNCFDYLDHQPEHDGQSVFECDKCTEIFSTRHDLFVHDKQHRRPCPECGKLILKTSMKLHLVQHTDRHMCPKCSHRFASRATLQQHIVTVHTNIRDHVCDACGKRFASKTSMNVHLKTHSEERLYTCKLCNYAGRTSSAIYIHMATHANEVHVCEVCSKSFKSNRNLSDHMRRVHSKEKKHQCNYCEKKFVDRYMLMVHVRSHTGVRPFKCNLCDKAFIRSDSLKEHMVVHGTRVLYDCESCAKKFQSKRGAARHHCSLMP